MDDKRNEEKYSEVDLSDFAKSGGDAFDAWGYARIKVQRGNVSNVVRIKIQSVPQDVIDAMQHGAPKPPSIDVMLDPTNMEHAALGVTTRMKGRMPNYNDADFQAKLRAHVEESTRRIVGMGVHPDEKLKNDDGSEALTPDERYGALQRMKLTSAHFADIATAISRLTSFSDEERQKFF